MHRTRRRFLRTAGGLSALGLAGCTGDDNGEGTDTPPTSEDPGTTTGVAGPATDGDPTTGDGTTTDGGGTTNDGDETTMEGSGEPAAGSDWPTYRFDAGNTAGDPDAVGPGADASRAWSARVSDFNSPSAAPAAVGDSLYVQMSKDLHAVSAADGSVRWTYETDGYFRGTPTVEDDVVYAVNVPGVLHAVDAETGDRLWRTNLDTTTVFGNATVVDGSAYVGCGEGNVFSVDVASGAVEWTTELTHRNHEGDLYYGDIDATPAVVDGTVYVPSTRKNSRNSPSKVVALDAETGSEEWEWGADPTEFGVSIPADGALHFDHTFKSVTVADGRLLVPTTLIEADDGTRPVIRHLYLFSLTAGGGQQWYHKFAEGRTGVRFGCSTLAYADGTAYVAYENGDGPALAALDADSGDVRWSRRDGWYGPVVAGDRVYTSNAARNVAVHDAATGDPLWSAGIEGAWEGAAQVANYHTVVDGALYVVGGPEDARGLTAYTAGGN